MQHISYWEDMRELKPFTFGVRVGKICNDAHLETSREALYQSKPLTVKRAKEISTA